MCNYDIKTHACARKYFLKYLSTVVTSMHERVKIQRGWNKVNKKLFYNLHVLKSLSYRYIKALQFINK